MYPGEVANLPVNYEIIRFSYYLMNLAYLGRIQHIKKRLLPSFFAKKVDENVNFWTSS